MNFDGDDDTKILSGKVEEGGWGRRRGVGREKEDHRVLNSFFCYRRVEVFWCGY